MRLVVSACLIWLIALPAIVTRADDFVPLFNGKDLSGWVPVNVAPNTFTVKDGLLVSTGVPTGTMRTEKMYENFVIELEWRHMKAGGNAGLFVWGDPITHVGVPFSRGIEVQILDHGYSEQFEQQSGKKADWFTTHGDVFPTGTTTMEPFPPTSPNGKRSFPRKNLSKGVGEWNHYYVRCINGEVRLWVNGEEVSGGANTRPATGYLCLESEGAPVEFKELRIRERP